MSRSGLFHLLPDLDREAPRPARRGRQTFEPLVVRAGMVDRFEDLDMAFGTEAANGSLKSDDPFASLGESFEESNDLSAFGDLADLSGNADLDFPDPAEFAASSEFADVLAETEGVDLAALDDPFADAATPAFPGLAEKSGPSVADELAAATAREAAAQSAHREEIDRLEKDHRAAIARLASEAIPAMREQVASELAAQIAPLLARRLRSDLVATTVAALTEEVKAILAESGAVVVEVRGSETLVSTFREQWDVDGVSVRTVVADGPDLVVRIDKAVMATRLGEFDRIIAEAIG